MVRHSRTDLFKSDDQIQAKANAEAGPTPKDPVSQVNPNFCVSQIRQKQAPPKTTLGPWYSRILCCTGKNGDKEISNNIVGKGLLTNAGIIQHDQVLRGPNEVGKSLLKNAHIDTIKNVQSTAGN